MSDITSRIRIIKGDITRLKVDAIVNAANSTLLGGGGVDGAIHQAAGAGLLEECKTLGGCAAGEAKLTLGYNLPAKYVIHTVGPIWRDGKNREAELLRSCYKSSLELARQNKIKTIAFPAVSTGVYRFPVEPATRIALETITDFLQEQGKEVIERVYLVCFDERTYEVYQALITDFL